MVNEKTVNIKMVSTIIFDFGGVIVNLDKERCIRKFNALGINDTEKFLGNFGQQGVFFLFEKGLISEDEFRNELRKMASRSLSDEEINDAWCSFLTGIPNEKLDLLVALRQKYRVLMLSNTNSLHIRYSQANYFNREGRSMSDCFDKCYLSNEMQMVKPDAEIFEALLADSGLKAEECLFLDDSKLNIETADSLHFKTRLINPHEDFRFLKNNKKK